MINTEAYSGSNSWHYARGYGSSGQGTPFSPITALEAGPGTQLDFSIAFKAASATGDGSAQNLYIGTTAGNDRTGFNIYLTNNSAGDGLSLHTFADPSFVETVFATNLSRTDWHVLTVSAVFDADPSNDVYQYSLNGNLLFTGNSWPNPCGLRTASRRPTATASSSRTAAGTTRPTVASTTTRCPTTSSPSPAPPSFLASVLWVWLPGGDRRAECSGRPTAASLVTALSPFEFCGD